MSDTPSDGPAAGDDQPASGAEPAADAAAVSTSEAPVDATSGNGNGKAGEIAGWKLFVVIGVVIVLVGGALVAYHYRGKIFKSASTTTTAPTAPIPRIEDNFQRADTNNIGKTSSGQGWQQVVGKWGISNNQAYVAEQNTKGPRNMVVTDLGSGDGAVSAQAPKLVDGWGLLFRYKAPTGYWRVYWNTQFKALHLVKFENNKETEAIPGGFAVPTAHDGMEVRVEFVGPNITIFVDDVPQRTVSDTYLSDQTKVGMYVDDKGSAEARWAKFVATSGPTQPVRTAPPAGAGRQGGTTVAPS